MPAKAANRLPQPNRPLQQMSTWKLQTEASKEWDPATQTEGPLTKRQLKRKRNKNSKLAKKSKSLEVDIDNMKSQMKALKDKITKASESTNARFKRKKIRSMKREADKIAEKLAASEAKLESIEQ